MFNENPGTCLLTRRGDSAVAHVEAPFCFPLFWLGLPFCNDLAESVYVGVFFFLREEATAHEKLSRPRLPRRSDAEIFIRCLFSFFPPEERENERERERERLLSVFKKQCRLCVWLKFFFFPYFSCITVILCSQREVQTSGRRTWRRGWETLWPALL